ncbi:hypothetical protein [Corynebacterium mastitidis]|nr:hypothetical protein [Corynebacterium mastitidis]MDK8449414.1 hypothetical protein [Corynebacterium mastitidis]
MAPRNPFRPTFGIVPEGEPSTNEVSPEIMQDFYSAMHSSDAV